MNSENVLYAKEYYSAMTKKEILPFKTTWIKLEGNYANRNKPDKDHNCMVSLLYGILKKNDIMEEKSGRVEGGCQG